MYCPKCGQQQMADNLNFCSRCGLPINEIAKWLENDENLVLREKGLPLKSPSKRRKNIRRGAKLMFISGVLFPIFFALSVAVDEPFPLLIPLTLFFAGLSVMLYSRLFIEETLSIKNEAPQPSRLISMFNNRSLPLVKDLWRKETAEQQYQTAELIKPPSITEHTTTLLDKNNNAS
ncbi:MAG: zinc ribbon domain-containing protein [Acidobacteriota bacterium]|nr:zinc ribbon domain-containing protein [Acidobacteriota bacterium]